MGEVAELCLFTGVAGPGLLGMQLGLAGRSGGLTPAASPVPSSPDCRGRASNLTHWAYRPGAGAGSAGRGAGPLGVLAQVPGPGLDLDSLL